VLPPLPTEYVTLGRLSLSFALGALRLVCVVASVAVAVGVTTEFFVLRLNIAGTLPNLFGARVLAPLDPPTVKMAAELRFRFRFLMISVLRY